MDWSLLEAFVGCVMFLAASALSASRIRGLVELMEILYQIKLMQQKTKYETFVDFINGFL